MGPRPRVLLDGPGRIVEDADEMVTAGPCTLYRQNCSVYREADNMAIGFGDKHSPEGGTKTKQKNDFLCTLCQVWAADPRHHALHVVQVSEMAGRVRGKGWDGRGMMLIIDAFQAWAQATRRRWWIFGVLQPCY